MSFFKKRKRKYQVPASDSLREEGGFKREEEPIEFEDDEKSTDLFKVHSKAAYEASKDLIKERDKIREKKKKSTSKTIGKHRENFKENLESLREEVTSLKNLLDKKQEISFKRTTSARTPKRKTSEREDCLNCNFLQSRIKTLEDQLRTDTQGKKEIERLRKEINSLHDEKLRIQQQFDEILEGSMHQHNLLSKEIDSIRRQYRDEEAAKNDALKRLSSMASSKLRDNNPNITDLSDQNRPTKIGEKLSELYDNQWTDAFDALEKQEMDEEQAISSLLGSLMKAYEECQKLANKNFFETVQGAIECPRQISGPSPNKNMMSDQFKQQVKELRKALAPKVIREIQQIVGTKFELANNPAKEITTYVSLCVEVGWLMAVQDPPLVLLGKAPVDFDNNRFKDYTKRGKYTEFVVWPALLLHENGPVLSKGVAQGSNSNPTSKSDKHMPEKTFKSQSLGRKTKLTKGNENKMTRSQPSRDSGYKGQDHQVRESDF